MTGEIQQIWQELQADLASVTAMWQVALIAAALISAWLINGALRSYVMQRAPEHWKLAIGGINRVLFPLSSLVFVLLSQFTLSGLQPTGLLQLASRLLFAMAVIRLIVYFLRYLFAPGGWLKTFENIVAWSIWGALALSLTGILPQIIQGLEEMRFNIGKNPVNLLLVLQALITVIITIFIALWLSRVLENKLLRAEHVNANLRVVLVKVLRIVLLFIAALIALSAVGLDITLLSVFGGALGVGMGFGLQRIASNYVSGFIVLLDKSMQIGDVITVEGHYGVVSDMRTRYLVLRKLDATEVIIPNEALVTNIVINHSFTNHKARVQMSIQVSYDSPLELAMRLGLDIAKRHPRVQETPEPTAFVKGFGENGIDLLFSIWILDPEEGSAGLQSEIYLDIWRAYQENNISIPYPQRVVRILENKLQ